MSILKTINCTTDKEFLDLLTPWSTEYKLTDYVFRGHIDESFLLHPNIMRTRNNLDLLKIAKITTMKGKYQSTINSIGITNIKDYHASIEMGILRRFYRSANENGLYVPSSKLMSSEMAIGRYLNFNNLMKAFNFNKWLNEDSIEIAALAQHYGLPTRLIDWSYSQYIASFFATNFITKPDKNKKVSLWMLNYKKLANLFSSPLSDVKIFSPHYQWNDNAKSQNGLFTYIESKHEAKEKDLNIEFLDDFMANGIESSDPKFNEVKTDYRTLDVALDDAITQYNAKKKTGIDTKDVLIKVTLPCPEALKVNKHLRNLRISEATIFPGYAGIAENLRATLRF
ncbi:hypothetical protein A3780_21600 [Kosakonia radicincitans]|uniref:FRG domain-containing protein n=1 Tax=Kosakonia radicincitans TaxID=283686 RepID=UPI00090375B5|nr:FRG domain-containing protein [Kosakonia radicincitans]APG20029.1 hypothetical protein A3780_21600 [Kosakonia radicincitans]